MQNKNLSQLEADLQHYTENIAVLTKKKSQYENQIKTILTRFAIERRKIRTHRLIERGAIAESIILDAELFTNEQIKSLLKVALKSAEAEEFISKLV